MQAWKSSLMLIFWFWLASSARQDATPVGLEITSPVPGAALQGLVTITGTTALPGFASSEVSFAYSREKPAGWFLIQESQTAVTAAAIAAWDTTTLTDGVYDLRVVVTLGDGSQQQALIAGVRVRNYTPIETRTPLPSPTANPNQARFTPTPTRALAATATALKLTLTPLPPNPAGVAGGDILSSLVKGGLAAVGLFVLGGLYLGLRHLSRR
jgi:hypothetical protein